MICVALNFLLTPLAIQAAFTLPFAQIAVDMGINPMAMYFTVMQGFDQILFPYEYAMYLFFFSFGIMDIKHFMQFMGTKILVNFIFVMAILIPYWKLIGFLTI